MPDLHPNENVFATQLVLRLEERAMKQAQLAKKIGVSNNTVSSWATGAGSPKAVRLPGIAQALQVNIGGLFGEEQGKLPAPKEGPFDNEAFKLIRLLANLRLTNVAERLAGAAPDLLEVLKQAERLTQE